MKKYIKYSLVFLILGLITGVFYREFSKAFDIVNVYTPLGLVHTHYLVLGMVFVLIVGLVTLKLEKEDSKLFKISFYGYIISVILAGLMLLVRGVIDVLTQAGKYVISDSGSAALSGVTGLVHACLGVFIVLIFISWLFNKKRKN